MVITVSYQWMYNHKVSHFCSPESFINCSLYTNLALIIHDISPQTFCPILNFTDCEYSHPLCICKQHSGCWPLWDHESELSDAQTGMSLQVYFTFSFYTFFFIMKSVKQTEVHNPCVVYYFHVDKVGHYWPALVTS